MLRLCLCLCAVCLAALPVAAQEVITDPAKAGPDFALVGEYVGSLDQGGERIPLGLQVAAVGGGRFRATIFAYGLPGAGWDGQTTVDATGETTGGKVTLKGEYQGTAFTIVPEGPGLVADAGPLGRISFARTTRVSPTMGAKPPAGATVLFDGASLDAWNGPGGAAPKPEQLDAGRINVHPEGAKGVGIGVITKQPVGDFSLHLEFMVPFMPEAKGQARANSGVYIQERYEVQVLDSFGLATASTGNGDVCGDVFKRVAASVNACLPPLGWQTYDIDFTQPRWQDGRKTANARLTVRLNGVLIHDDVEVPDKTGSGKAEGPEPRPLMLQDHGYPVWFRNVWLAPRSGR
jgi:hypothetical protein